ncbi:MAG TPA: V4R domain-containing protein [Anaerolineae bacterium]|nr:V4R domain-containing protein [Anaerolineae bacterium]
MTETAYEKSGYYYPNLIARIYLEAIEDIMGSNGIKALLNMAHMEHLKDNYPPGNLSKEFDFADFAHLNEAMEMMYGPRGGRALSLRAGRKAFDQGLKNFGPMVGVADVTFRMLPLKLRMKIGLGAMAKAFSSTSDQISYVEEKEDHFLYVIERCPVCWGRHSETPMCHAALGIILEGLNWGTSGKKFKTAEVTCIGRGDPACNFTISKEPID